MKQSTERKAQCCLQQEKRKVVNFSPKGSLHWYWANSPLELSMVFSLVEPDHLAVPIREDLSGFFNQLILETQKRHAIESRTNDQVLQSVVQGKNLSDAKAERNRTLTNVMLADLDTREGLLVFGRNMYAPEGCLSAWSGV